MTPNPASPASGPVLADACKADGTAGVRFVGLDPLSQSQCRLITSNRWILSINWEDHCFCCVRSHFFFCSLQDPRIADENNSKGPFRSSCAWTMLRALFYGNPIATFSSLTLEPSTDSDLCSVAHETAYSIACVIALTIKSFCLYLNGIVPLLIRDPFTISAAGKVQPNGTQILAFIQALAGASELPSITPITCSSLHHSRWPSLSPLPLFSVLFRKWGLKMCTVLQLQPYPDCIMLHLSLCFCHTAAPFLLYTPWDSDCSPCNVSSYALHYLLQPQGLFLY